MRDRSGPPSRIFRPNPQQFKCFPVKYNGSSFFWFANCWYPVVMGHDFSPSKLTKPGIEDLDIVLIEEPILSEALEWVSGCENCAENAFTTFDYLLDAVTGCDPIVTEYMMWRPGLCPQCAGDVTEKTHVGVQ